MKIESEGKKMMKFRLCLDKDAETVHGRGIQSAALQKNPQNVQGGSHCGDDLPVYGTLWLDCT